MGRRKSEFQLLGRAAEKAKVRAKKRKEKKTDTDGLGPKELRRIRTALRQVWSWSLAHRLVRKRCQILGTDFARCEKCKQRAAKVYVDHINRLGAVDKGFIERLFVPSAKLQGLCRACHGAKTRLERMDDQFRI